MDGFRVLTDPVFEGWLWMMSRSDELGLDPANLPPVDAVLISHTHMDHFDPWSIAQVKPRVPVLFAAAETSPAHPSVFYRDMVHGKPAYDLPWWHSYTVRNREGRVARITAVPAAHWGGRLAIDGAWSYNYGGFVIESGGHTVYFAGDTGWNPEYFRAIAKRFPHIELALMPIGPVWSRESTLMTRHHVNPKQALAAFQILGADYFIPIHYGAFYEAFGRGEMTLNWLKEEIAKAPHRERIAIVRTGEEWRYHKPVAVTAKHEATPAPSN